MGRLRGGPALIALVAAAMMLATAVVAQAHTRVYFNTLTIKFRSSDAGDRFYGRVNSAKPACEKRRRVVVLRTDRRGDVRIGTDVTAGDGKWDIDPAGRFVPPGVYYAKMRKKVLRRSGGHNHTCSAVTTPPITVGR